MTRGGKERKNQRAEKAREEKTRWLEDQTRQHKATRQHTRQHKTKARQGKPRQPNENAREDTPPKTFAPKKTTCGLRIPPHL
jgi:hypothetical protein